jgi:Uncharacterized protein conserved in bacteria
VETRSFHFIADPRFASAVADFLARETRAVGQERDALAEYSPFRCGEGTGGKSAGNEEK